MKVAIFIPSLRGGGAERSMLTLANQLAKRKYRVDLILVKNEGAYVDDVHHEVNLFDLNRSRVLKSIFSLRSYISNNKPAILISAMGHVNIVSVVACRLSGSDTINIVGERNSLNFSTGLIGLIKKNLMKWAYTQAEIVTAVSEDVRSQILDQLKISPSKVKTIYNPVVSEELIAKSLEKPSHDWLRQKDKPVILGAGRLTKQKDFTTLIKAFKQVQKFIDCRLIIVGEGEDRNELEQIIRDSDLESSVSLPGFVTNPFSYLSHSDLFVLPSLWEGLPGVLIQAMACRVPVISTDCPGGAREILKDGEFGALVPVADSDQLANKMVKYLKNLSEAPNGVKRAHDFSVEKSVDAYEKLFESILS